MQISVGWGGWAQVIPDGGQADEVELPAVSYVRFAEVPSGHWRAVEVYLDGRGEQVRAEALRRYPLTFIETAVTTDPGMLETLQSWARHAGPDLTRLASHFDTAFWRDRDTHWVARSWRAQIKDSGEPQAPMGKLRSPAPRTPEEMQLPEPSEGLTPEFLGRVAAAYREAIHVDAKAPARVLSQVNPQVSYRTIHRWIYEARRRGVLPRGSQGRVG
ncbi:hypothetical protein GCM10010169_25490 [Micromonospora fulviviridis]|uniref:hypothetical protein n=1 Tax=Micromonospora fulviviridis TaxID=47860 RepID=UPI00166A6507|nr:hypothetical protein [Micromonospora fulviviridis]GGR80236.1 hypothetical protein GCM10010169_25490 [Micromonospora fulviviridis]